MAASRPPSTSPFGERFRTAREAVSASQRGRLLEAMARAAAAKGYAAVTISDIAAGAGVSRRTFYEQFADKEECFLAAFEMGAEFLLARIEEEQNAARLGRVDWRSRVRLVFDAYTQTLAAEPDFAYVMHVDVVAASRRSHEHWAGVIQRFADLYRELHEAAREQDPEIPPPSDTAFLILAGGIAEVTREYARRGKVKQLPDVAPEIAAHVEAVISGCRSPA